MNLSPSSSFSSSVTTISSNNSHDITSKGPTPTVQCLVHILRRMFCSRTLPSSDQATESNSGDGAVNCHSTPGIVARLMGLESLPENSNSPVTSSRSANYVKKRGEEVKRELSNYIELEDDEFFILSFERGGEIKELRQRKRKLKKRREEKAETEESSIENRADQISEGLEGGQSDTNPIKKSKDRSSLRIKQVEAECSSEDLSPVSVLDYGEFIRDPEPKSSDDSGLESWKLSAELQTVEQSLPHEDSNSINELEPKKISEGSRKKDFRCEEFSDLWCDIRKILERDQMVEYNWAHKGLWRIEECEGIGSELELQILDHILDEVLEDQFS